MLKDRRAFPEAIFLTIGSWILFAAGPIAPLLGQSHEGSTGHHSARTMVTGTGGSQTGTASFVGNFTAMETPSGAVALVREIDCSLTLATGTYTINSAGLTYSETDLIPAYEQVLHHQAGLTSKADVFAKPCALQPPLGVGSAVGAFVGTTTSDISVFAAVGTTYPNFVNGIYILSGQFEFSLASFQDISAGQVTAADLNKDGNGDLVISDSPVASSAYVTVMLGKPDGTFQNGVTYAIAGDYSVAATIDDVTGDGVPDIVAVSGDQQISVLAGKGDGTFGSATSFKAPLPPGFSNASQAPISNLITADLRGAGRRDLIASNGLVLLNNGSGSFAAAASPAFPYVSDNVSSYGPFLASGDMNNDGKADLVVSENDTVTIWLGNGNGTFTMGQSYADIDSAGRIAVTDLDGDGNADIYLGLGSGAFYGGDNGTPNLSYALMGNGDGTVKGAPAIPGGGYSGNNLVDLNGSGTLSIVTNAAPGLQSTPVFTVWKGDGKGGVTKASTVSAPDTFSLASYNFSGVSKAAATSYALADINGDGKADLVFVNNNLTATAQGSSLPITYPYPVYFVSQGNGDGTFQAPMPFSFPQIAPAPGFDNQLNVAGLQIADFNKDGHLDLIFTYNDVAGGSGNPYLQGFVVLAGNGNGTFSATAALTSTYNSASAPTTAKLATVTNIADLNGDGAQDIIAVVPAFTVATGATTQVKAFLGNGNGTFKAPVPITLAANAYGIPVLADLNKDNILDIAFVTENSSSQAGLAVALGKGDGTFATPLLSNLAGGDAIRNAGLAGADFNTDGNVDLALIENAAYSGVFYGNGDGTFTSVTSNGTSVPKDLIDIAVGTPAVGLDINKDGKPDILAGNVALLNVYGSSPVTLSPSTTSLNASSTSIAPGTNVTFTASVSAAVGGAGNPTGTVRIMDGAHILETGTLSSGNATSSIGSLGPGAHAIAASYLGDTNFTGSTSPVVTITVGTVTGVGTTTTLTPSATTATTGTSLSFTAKVAAVSGSTTPSGTVNFTDGGAIIGSGTLNSSGAAIFTTSSLSLGAHTIAAEYTGGNGFSGSTSSLVTVTISAAAPDFSVSITPASGTETNSSPATATVTITPSNGFNSVVTLACTGLPTGVTCAFNPTTVTPSGSAATTTMSISRSTSAMIRPYGLTGGSPVLLSFFGLGMIMFFRRRRSSSMFSMMGVVVLGLTAIVGITGCGGGSSRRDSSQQSTVKITATSGSVSHAVSYTLTTSK